MKVILSSFFLVFSYQLFSQSFTLVNTFLHQVDQDLKTWDAQFRNSRPMIDDIKSRVSQISFVGSYGKRPRKSYQLILSELLNNENFKKQIDRVFNKDSNKEFKNYLKHLKKEKYESEMKSYLAGEKELLDQFVEEAFTATKNLRKKWKKTFRDKESFELAMANKTRFDISLVVSRLSLESSLSVYLSEAGGMNLLKSLKKQVIEFLEVKTGKKIKKSEINWTELEKVVTRVKTSYKKNIIRYL